MIAPFLTFILFTGVLAVCMPASAQDLGDVDPRYTRDPIVKIVANVEEHVSIGTGFVTQVGGSKVIVTCYHVIRGSDSVRILGHSGRVFGSVTTAKISPHRDLAVLMTNSIDDVKPLMPVNKFPPDLEKKQLRIIGHPKAIAFSGIGAKTTHPGLVLGNMIGEEIFADPKVEVLPLHVDADNEGLSGGPVLSDQGVMAVFCASVNDDQGAGLAWAIPIAYAAECKEKIEIDNTTSWPELGLTTKNFRSLQIKIPLGVDAVEAMHDYFEMLDAIHRDSQRVENVADTAASICRLAIRHYDALGDLPDAALLQEVLRFFDLLENLRETLEILNDRLAAGRVAENRLIQHATDLRSQVRLSIDTLAKRHARDMSVAEIVRAAQGLADRPSGRVFGASDQRHTNLAEQLNLAIDSQPKALDTEDDLMRLFNLAERCRKRLIPKLRERLTALRGSGEVAILRAQQIEHYQRAGDVCDRLIGLGR